MSRHYLFSLLLLLLSSFSFAREGMWIPMLIEQNIGEMQQMGFRLNADDIYSVNHSSMKDAIVHFGGGCTGELISPEGLLVTNYHCGYSEIQSHSSVENDYLSNGFWAANRNEELPNPNLTVTFLVRMEEVTDQVLAGSDTLKSIAQIDSLIEKHIADIEKQIKDSSEYGANIKPFYEGNQYYLFVTQTFTDVRLVGAPPSAIGKFGGDTDNWMWPRHTGDFSLFRIYADKDNKPAPYSPDNVPYAPKSFFPINISGVEEGDFTMVFGYPGRTQQYLPSQAVKIILEESDPDRVAIRDIKLKIVADHMQKDDKTRIQYAAKYASTSNSWKKWQGEIVGLKRLKTFDIKQQEEKYFSEWVATDSIRKKEYARILPLFDSLYASFAPLSKAYDYYTECIYRGTDVFKNYQFFQKQDKAETNADSLRIKTAQQFKDFSLPVDEEVFTSLLVKYYNDLPKEYLPQKLIELFNGKDYQSRIRHMYENSFLTREKGLYSMLSESKEEQTKSIKKDELYNLIDAISNQYYDKVSPGYWSLSNQISSVQKKYMKAIFEMRKGEMIFPDANSTLRVSYGKVEGYKARNGVDFRYYTTLGGVFEKISLGADDYIFDQKLKALYDAKDYGRYALPDSTLPVCFIASNHTTGGNSGSPVIDASGNLIGINFDRCWEGTMSDIDFDPEKCRNISLDMRYMLFIIEKYAGAGYLLSEMKIIE